MLKFLKTMPQIILAPALIVGMAALVLYVMGMTQDYLRPPEHGPRDYASVEAAEASLGFKIALPSYFPDYLSWPPAEIRGQLLPSPRAEIFFDSTSGESNVLVIYQIATDSDSLPVPLPLVKNVLEETPVSIGDSEGVMVSAEGTGGQALSGAYWKSGGVYFANPNVNIARSM